MILLSLWLVLGLGFVALVALGLPGGWLLFLLTLGLNSWGPLAGSLGAWTLGAGLGFLLLGEGLELSAGVLGAKQADASRRGMVGALLGGLAGAVLGTFIPIPIIGTLFGSVLGTFSGALIAETTGEEAREVNEAVTPALGATLGRLLGTVGKLSCSVVVWGLFSGVLILHQLRSLLGIEPG